MLHRNTTCIAWYRDYVKLFSKEIKIRMWFPACLRNNIFVPFAWHYSERKAWTLYDDPVVGFARYIDLATTKERKRGAAPVNTLRKYQKSRKCEFVDANRILCCIVQASSLSVFLWGMYWMGRGMKQNQRIGLKVFELGFLKHIEKNIYIEIESKYNTG